MADTALTSPLSPQSPGGASASTKAPAMSMNSLWRASKCSANTCYIFTVLGIIVSALLIALTTFYFNNVNVVKPFSDTVVTKLGRVKGVQTATTRMFLGMPYAHPPLDKRRFKPSQLRTNDFAQNPYHATAPKPVCMQANRTANEVMSEDCLFLNIYTPLKPNTADYLHGYPVMVYLHGGDFTAGSGTDFQYNGTKLVQKGNVLVVTLSYRLGVFGFFASKELTTDTPGWPSTGGMNGVHDQYVALQWIKEHIRDFGGDHERVTIFGDSAGGLSACALAVAPGGDGLFQRAIMQSGSCVGPYAPQSSTDATALFSSFTGAKPALYTNGTTGGNKIADWSLAGLRNASSKSLQAAWQSWYTVANANMQIPLWSVDGRFLPCSPQQLYAGDADGFRMVNSDSIMIGSDTTDGYPSHLKGLTDTASLQSALTTAGLDKATATLAADNYTQGGVNATVAWTNIHSDTCVTCPTLELAHVVANTGCNAQRNPGNDIPVYLYRFSGKRGDETADIWGAPDDSDRELSISMMDLWLAYAKAGEVSSTSASGASITGGALTWASFKARCNKDNGTMTGPLPQYMSFGKGTSGAAMTKLGGASNAYHHEQCSNKQLWQQQNVKTMACQYQASK